MRLRPTLTRTGPARRAFTITEILVVLLILSILSALTAGAVVRVMESQKKANTRVTIDKLNSQLVKQWNTYKDAFSKEDAARLYKGPPYNDPWNYVLYTLSADSSGLPDVKRARVIWVKLRMRQVFPMNFNEAILPITLGTSGAQLPPVPAYVNALAQVGINSTNVPSAAAAAPYESSACLLMALQQAPSSGGATLESLGVASSMKNFAITNVSGNTNSVQAFADEWGQPLQFARWGTAYARLGNFSLSGQSGAANDPADPEGTLTAATWLRVGGLPTGAMTPGRLQFQALCHAVPDRQASPTGSLPMSFKLVPVLISRGPDKYLGLIPPTLASPSPTDPYGSENDNLDNLP